MRRFDVRGAERACDVAACVARPKGLDRPIQNSGQVTARPWVSVPERGLCGSGHFGLCKRETLCYTLPRSRTFVSPVPR